MTEVSVVMGVRNGEDNLRDTIDSVLMQKDVDLEFLIINDGSRDKTEQILSDYAMRDPRLIYISRDHKGLTESLIEGCKIAKGMFIARQDANDISLPGRLYEQAKCLYQNKSASMCSTNVRFKTREGVVALNSSASPDEIATGLTGTIHGSVMMRRDMYEKVGGYRSEFYYAQDVDLWTRLVEIGEHILLPKVYYEGSLTPNSISGSRRGEQRKLFFFIKQATKARRIGRDEAVWVNKALEFSEKCKKQKNNQRKEADGAYFIGACLTDKNAKLAAKYFKDTLELNPMHLRARVKLASIK